MYQAHQTKGREMLRRSRRRIAKDPRLPRLLVAADLRRRRRRLLRCRLHFFVKRGLANGRCGGGLAGGY